MRGIYGMHPKLSRENEAGKNIYIKSQRLQRNFSCGGLHLLRNAPERSYKAIK